MSIITRAPFRLPLGGGGCDLPAYYTSSGAHIYTSAISHYMYVIVSRPPLSNRIKISYSQIEEVPVDEIQNIRHDIVRATLLHLRIDFPLEIHSIADLSAGTGMGSSGAYTVALLQALYTLLKQEKTALEIAEEACQIEMELLRRSVGKQDQYASACGGILDLDIDKQGNVQPKQLQLDQETIHELEHRLMIFYTGIQRNANKILTEQAAKILTHQTSREGMERIQLLGHQIAKALEQGDIDAVGELMDSHWREKRNLTQGISSPEIDTWYTTARSHGAIGGKLMGAGGGGFFLFVVQPHKRRDLRKALLNKGMVPLDFHFDFSGVKTLVQI